MKFLLTGHRGYLGSHIHRFLLINYPDAEMVILEEDKSDIDAYRQSVLNCVGSHNFTHVIHVGAASSTTNSCQDCFDWNYRATQILSDYVGSHAYFMYFSSCAGNDPVTTPYGFSKRATVNWLRSRCDALCTFIPYNIYGKEVGRTKKYSNPENIVRRQVTYVAKPFIRDYIHIDDCLRMIRQAIDDDKIGTLEMGTGIAFDFKTLCEAGGIDTSRMPIFKPNHHEYPVVGPAPRVAESPYLPPEVNVVEWIRRHINVFDST